MRCVVQHTRQNAGLNIKHRNGGPYSIFKKYSVCHFKRFFVFLQFKMDITYHEMRGFSPYTGMHGIFWKAYYQKNHRY
jgi:hypothetical protein